MPEVNPELLVWARRSAGLSGEEAARKLGFRPASGKSAAERLAALESGAKPPTQSQLFRMSERYRQPLIAFYLERPPPGGDALPDFRTLPQGANAVNRPHLDALIRDVQAAQALVRDLLQDEGATPLDFVGALHPSAGLEAIHQALVELLGSPRDRDRAPSFATLRQKAEASGVFVLLRGDLGSYHTDLDTSVFRGLSLADGIAPFVVINDNDAKAARSFTLVHELVHLLLGQSGVGNDCFDNDVERLCNDAASRFLLAPDALPALDWRGLSGEELVDWLDEQARDLGISSAHLAYRLWRSDRLGADAFRRVTEVLRQRWEERRERASPRPQAGFAPPVKVKQHALGQPLRDLVRRSLRARNLTTTKAAVILGVSPRQVGPILGI